MKKSPLKDAIAKLGGVEAASKALGISKQAVSAWDRCPPSRVLDLERLTKVSRHKLRPDIFGSRG